MQKKLYRNTDDKIIAGVMSGLSEYFNYDPTLGRLGAAILLVLTGLMPGVVLYLVAWIIIPEAPHTQPTDYVINE